MSRTRVPLVAIMVSLAVLASACGTARGSEADTIRLVTYEGFRLPQDQLDAFTSRTGFRVSVTREASASDLAQLLLRTRQDPVADVVVGLGPLEVRQIVEQAATENYTPIGADRLDPRLMLTEDVLTPVSVLDVCLNIDIDYYQPPEVVEEFEDDFNPPAEELPEGAVIVNAPPSDTPTGIGDFTDPRFIDQLVVPDPNTDPMGVYFLAMLENRYPLDGPEPWTDVLAGLVANGMLVTPTWREAYFEQFTEGSVEGTRTAVVASDRMPVVTARLRFRPPDRLETQVIDDGCVAVPFYAGVITGTHNRRAAGRLVDQIVTPEFQFDIGDDMGSWPARFDLIDTELDARYQTRVEADPLDPMTLPDRVDDWLEIWAGVLSGAIGTAPTQPPTTDQHTDTSP
ncbi:MAG TPA: hypothetical protein ENI86_08405 [Acidimicrobiales bacterium]|nr:hypothetical protein [Acidimicrobiales bacterium]